jgi:hypothetical protein
MIEAETLMTYRQGVAGSVKVFGVWIPRQGDNAKFSVEVSTLKHATLTVEVFQKGMDDVGDGTAYAPSTTMVFTTTGRQAQEWLGVKEAIRFSLVIAPTEALPEGEFGWVMFRFLHPIWFESVKA